jgi:hypothetical protein
MAATRIANAAEAAGYESGRVDEPAALPASSEIAIAFVDWGDRQPGWAGALQSWRAAVQPEPRLLLFGPHTDLEAHAEARRHGLGPMMARSKLFASLPALLRQ